MRNSIYSLDAVNRMIKKKLNLSSSLHAQKVAKITEKVDLALSAFKRPVNGEWGLKLATEFFRTRRDSQIIHQIHGVGLKLSLRAPL